MLHVKFYFITNIKENYELIVRFFMSALLPWKLKCICTSEQTKNPWSQVKLCRNFKCIFGPVCKCSGWYISWNSTNAFSSIFTPNRKVVLEQKICIVSLFKPLTFFRTLEWLRLREEKHYPFVLLKDTWSNAVSLLAKVTVSQNWVARSEQINSRGFFSISRTGGVWESLNFSGCKAGNCFHTCPTLCPHGPLLNR